MFLPFSHVFGFKCVRGVLDGVFCEFWKTLARGMESRRRSLWRGMEFSFMKCEFWNTRGGGVGFWIDPDLFSIPFGTLLFYLYLYNVVICRVNYSNSS